MYLYMYVCIYICINYISSGFGPSLGLGRGKPEPGPNKVRAFNSGPDLAQAGLFGPNFGMGWAGLGLAQAYAQP